MTTLPIYLEGTQQFQIRVDDSTLITKAVIGENKIPVELTTNEPITALRIGATTTINGETFTINTAPRVERKSNRLAYSFILEGPIYKWFDKIVMRNGVSDFGYYGTAADILNILIENINEIDPGWSAGSVVATEPQHISFADQSCRAALSLLLDQFKLEFHSSGNGKIINIVKQVGVTTPYTFSYGRGNGLYSLARTAVDDKTIVTKVYGYGSSRNLPLSYRDGIGRLTFAERFIASNIDLYGIKEGAYTDEEIYPRRLGVVTSVSTYDESSATFSITDSSVDFNVADQILEGVEGLVSFKTGELAGSEFVITAYNHSTKTVTLKKSDSAGERLPNTTYQPAAGDTYVFLDIEMPQSYIEAAETELRTRTQEYSDENSVPRVAYSLELDPRYMREVQPVIKPGDKIRIVDEELGIDAFIRIAAMTYPIVPIEEYTGNSKISLVIADFIPYTTQERLKADTIDNKRDIKIITKATEKVKAEIDNARSTLDRVKGITDFLTTTMDGNVVATGTMIVGDAAGNNNAGVSGVVDIEHFPVPGDNVRFWAGAPYEQRGIAPWRVLQNGSMYSTRGFIGGFDIGSDSLVRSTSPTKDRFEVGTTYQHVGDYLLIRKNSPITRGKTKEFSTNLNGVGTGNYTVLITNNIENNIAGGGDNIALRLEAAGATFQDNIALQIIAGRIKIGNDFGMNGTLNISVAEGTYPGAVGFPPITISPGDADNVKFKVVNGLIMGNIGRP